MKNEAQPKKSYITNRPVSVSGFTGKRPAQWKKYIYGQGHPHLSFEQLRMTTIALPPLAEQTRIVAEVERRLSVVEELESVVSANIHRATRLRQSILQKVLLGI